MSAFRTPLVLEHGGDRRLTLTSPLLYDSDVLGVTIAVPTGFVTDLASIPRGLWNILPPIGRYDRAAVVHDYLYACGFTTRKQADDVLYEAMRVTQVGRVAAWTIYAGVRLGGGAAWARHRAR